MQVLHKSSISPLAIRMAPGTLEGLRTTVCRFKPEFGAVLAVHPDDPLRVVEVRPVPAKNGNSSATHYQIDDRYVEYYLNVELLADGLMIGGVFHTHPGSFNRLSGGTPGSGQGDIPVMRAALEGARKMPNARKWENFLAPIGTIDPATGEPTFTGWIVRLDHPDPIRVDIIDEAQESTTSQREARSALPIDGWMGLGSHYQGLVNQVLADRVSPKEHRQWMAEFIHQTMREDLTQRFKATFELSQSNLG
ncbi:hypothetical protein [Agrobacterium cavarae]|uniref:hypothetical protein n=1 Tax=Agrobacterium cavarae TaxID=2528239 RepID=UPI002FD94EDF